MGTEYSDNNVVKSAVYSCVKKYMCKMMWSLFYSFKNNTY